MTRTKRKLVVGLCLCLVWVWFASYLWLRHQPRYERAGQLTNLAAYDFGVVRWLTLEPIPLTAGSAAAPKWHIDPVGMGLLVFMSALLGLLTRLVWRWLVRNSSLQGVCDYCGYKLVGGSGPEQCPECGEVSSAAQRRLQINARSARMLFIALTLAGLAAAGMTAPILAHAAHTFCRAANRTNFAWKYVEWSGTAALWSLFVFLFAAILFATWLYFEPAKHFRRKERSHVGVRK